MPADAVNYLEKRAGGSLDQATLRRSLFMLSGEDAIWHLLKVPVRTCLL